MLRVLGFGVASFFLPCTISYNFSSFQRLFSKNTVTYTTNPEAGGWLGGVPNQADSVGLSKKFWWDPLGFSAETSGIPEREARPAAGLVRTGHKETQTRNTPRILSSLPSLH